MKAIRRCISTALFFLIGAAIFFCVQSVLTQKGADLVRGTEKTLLGLNGMEPDTVDVLFLGSSQVYNGISPLKIYEQTGITSFALASSGQPPALSYLLLKDTYTRQSPKVVLLEVGSLLAERESEQSNLFWRDVLDVLPWGETKLEAARLYAEQDFGDGSLSAFFPMIKYHTRWKELDEMDLCPVDAGQLWTFGERATSYVTASPYSRQTADGWSETLDERRIGRTERIENGRRTTEAVYGPPRVTEISDSGREYLEKICALCREHGSDLVLFKTPKNTVEQYDDNAWTKDSYECVRQAAEELGVPFLDLNYAPGFGVDPQTDFCDGGWHLNIRGAHKISSYLGRYLRGECGLEGGTEGVPSYDRALEKYQKLSAVAYLETETVFEDYIERLIKDGDGLTVCIAACSDYTSGLDDTDYALLEELGLALAGKGRFMDSYAAVISGGRPVYEELSDKKIEHTVKTGGRTIRLTSGGWLAGMEAAIAVDGVQTAMGRQGLDLVVIDNETGLVIDTVSFDTVQSGKPCARVNETSADELKRYLAAIS